jgi:hypothetical protein
VELCDRIFAVPLTPMNTDVKQVYCAFCGKPLSISLVLLNGVKDDAGENMFSCKNVACNRAGWGK